MGLRVLLLSFITAVATRTSSEEKVLTAVGSENSDVLATSDFRVVLPTRFNTSGFLESFHSEEGILRVIL